MARQTESGKIRGKIGNKIYRIVEGQQVISEHNPISKKRFRTDDAFANSRRTGREFGGGSTISKTLRKSISEGINRFGTNRQQGRFTKVITNILRTGVLQRGNPIFRITEENKHFLEGFELNKDLPLAYVFNMPWEMEVNNNLSSITIKIPSVDINRVQPPPYGQFFRLCCIGTVLTDHLYDGKNKRYVSVSPELNGVNSIAFSQPISIADDHEKEVNWQLDLSLPIPLSDKSHLILWFGIEFLQLINGSIYELPKKRAMKVVAVM